MKALLPIAYVAFMALTHAAQAADFDCAQARTSVEQQICADADLRRLDRQLQTSYLAAVKGLADVDHIRAVQQDWLRSERDACTTADCLKQAYSKRIDQLDGLSTAARNRQIPGVYRRYSGGKPDDHAAALVVSGLRSGRYHLQGQATWVGNAELGGVNVGDVEGTFEIVGGDATYSDEYCSMKLHLTAGTIQVSNYQGECGGMNVSFNGEYRKEQK